MTNAGSLSVLATETDGATNTTEIASGGALNGQGTNATAEAQPTISGYIASADCVTTTGAVSVHAISTAAEATATAKAYGGGGLQVGVPHATVTSSPTVSGYIGSGGNVSAGGNVTVDAEADSEPTESQPPTDNIQNVNTSTSVITFPNSGLQTGDLVDYVQGTASSPIGTPSGPLETTIVQSDGTITQERSYPVLVIDANTLQLGAQFNAQQADTSGYFSTAVGIDPTLDVIRFATPDGLETGDAVEYNPNGNTPLAGLNTSSIYYVKAIDPYTIKLYNTYPEATATPTGVTPSNVNTTNNTIDVSNSFTNGENVTYDAPAPFEFQSGVVDVESNSDGSLVLDSSNNPEYNLGANNIYIGENTTGGSTPNTTANLQTGDMVLYEASNPADPIGGLVSGQEYYVYRQSTYYIQLCATYADATHTILGFADPITLTLTPDLSSTGKQVNQVLAQPALGNLQSGADVHGGERHRIELPAL